MTINLDNLRELSLAEKLSKVSRLWKTVADSELAPLGLTNCRWTALWKLQRLGNFVSQKHLAEALEIELGSLMRTLNQLEEQGLIARHVCPQDKRARIVSLTEDGKVLLDSIEDKVLSVRKSLLNGIDKQQIELLNQLLEIIALNADQAIQTKSSQ